MAASAFLCDQEGRFIAISVYGGLLIITVFLEESTLLRVLVNIKACVSMTYTISTSTSCVLIRVYLLLMLHII